MIVCIPYSSFPSFPVIERKKKHNIAHGVWACVCILKKFIEYFCLFNKYFVYSGKKMPTWKQSMLTDKWRKNMEKMAYWCRNVYLYLVWKKKINCVELSKNKAQKEMNSVVVFFLLFWIYICNHHEFFIWVFFMTHL